MPVSKQIYYDDAIEYDQASTEYNQTQLSDFLNDAFDDLVAILQGITGLRVVDDPRNIAPPCAFVDAPSIESFNYNIVKMTFPVTLISTGPGNLDALRQLLHLTAALLLKNVAVMSASPKVVTVGGQEFAGYEVIIPIQAQNG
tara:strand:- start:59 stop:487 length:429 start_codon:yes stop_codon:yes gene_type:complete